jgi:hypothetical protein
MADSAKIVSTKPGSELAVAGAVGGAGSRASIEDSSLWRRFAAFRAFHQRIRSPLGLGW